MWAITMGHSHRNGPYHHNQRCYCKTEDAIAHGIGPETTWNESLIVVGRHLLRGGKLVMGGHVYNYSDATRADTEKWRGPVESPHRIGMTIIWSDVLTAVGGAWAGDQKNSESE